MDHNSDFVSLGNTGIQISTMGLGTWAWGDRLFWGYGGSYDIEDVCQAFVASLAGGINFIDTAEVYGQGNSERIIGEILRESGANVIIATKFQPFPWRLSRAAFIKALRASLKRLGRESVELYQIHWPFPPVPVETWANALADAIELGLTLAVGVSNYNAQQMRRTHTVLVKRGVLLASNQVEFSLLNRQAESSGLLSLCHELGVTLIAYSPLTQGLLTGKYTPQNTPSGFRAIRYNSRYLAHIQPLIRLLREIGGAHGGKTPAQVALNWTICKGTVPIPGAKNAHQAEENIGALGWRLTNEEVTRLDGESTRLNSIYRAVHTS